MSRPPIMAQRLLRWFAGKADLEDIIGDLDEVYGLHLTQRGKLRAGLSYWKHVLSVLFSYGLKKRKSQAAYSTYYPGNSITMFKNYFKIAIRNFSKQKLFTSLNVFGLSLGMSICLLALSMAVAIYRSDEFHEHKDRIYQLNTRISDVHEDKTCACSFKTAGSQLKSNYPFIEDVVNIHSDFRPVFNHQDNKVEARGYYASQAFFEVFSFELISGDPKSVLENPFSIVLTQKTAYKLFRDENPIGKTLETDMGTFNITGVMKDLKQTHFFFEVLASYETREILEPASTETDWVNFKDHYTYVLLQKAENNIQLEEALTNLSQEASLFHPNKEIDLESVVLTSVVPRWNVSNAIGTGWDTPTLIFFLSIGFLVLLPAIFNYTNLSIARALKRAKEIGVRKVVGAEKMQIKAQFIIETVVLAIFALIGSFFLMIPMKREFLSMVYAAQVLDTDLNGYQLATFLVFALLVGLMAGVVPARYFSRLNPIQTIKGEIKNGKNSVSGFKKGLFVFQFFLSLVFIIGVAAIGKQYSYALNNNHGFQSDNILTVPFNGIEKQVAMNELGNHPDVRAVTATSSLPGVFISKNAKITSNELDSIHVKEVFVSDLFVQNMKMNLAWGESQTMTASNQNEELVIVNQQFIKAIKVFNIQKDTLRFTLEDGTKCRIVGILEDFNFEPLSELINPLIIRHSLARSQYALLTINSTNIKKTILEVEAIWRNIDQGATFESRFLNAEIEDAYYFLSVQIKFFSVLSILAITISCLGLLGMVSFTTENRTKEIAVRKIMGATNRSLYVLLTKDFLKLIGLSVLIATPFSYFFYDKLFLHFLIRYGTGLGIIEVVLSIAFLFLVGISSIYWQTSRVTKSNPATKLRYE